jgi:hypothetical protein
MNLIQILLNWGKTISGVVTGIILHSYYLSLNYKSLQTKIDKIIAENNELNKKIVTLNTGELKNEIIETKLTALSRQLQEQTSSVSHKINNIKNIDLTKTGSETSNYLDNYLREASASNKTVNKILDLVSSKKDFFSGSE